MNFQQIVLTIALVLLVIMLIMVAYLMKNAQDKAVFPPYVDECPDYWEVVGEETCNNVQNLGKCAGVKNFTNFVYGGETGLEAKKKWANDCGITWSGVTTD